MILKLYDANNYNQNGQLKLRYFDLFQERLKYLSDNFFSVDRYRRFYCKQTSDKSYVGYWFGVKPVGHMQKNENVKNTLDYLSGYLLNSRDFDTNKIKKRYLELLEKKGKVEITSDESKELDGISKLILYKKPTRSFKMNKNMIFLVNVAYEKFTQDISTLSELSRIKFNIVDKVKSIGSLLENKKQLTCEISELYNSLKSNGKDKEIVVKVISANTHKIKTINNEVNYLRKSIEELYSDYYYITENKILK